MTVDFGFYRMSLSGTVWNDIGAGANTDNGILDAGESAMSSPLTVRLYNSAAVEIPVGPDGILGTSDDAVGGMLTNGAGNYSFQGLAPGTYRVVVTPPISPSSTPTDINADNNDDNDDNGFPDNTGSFPGRIIAGLIVLTPGGEPIVTNATGTTSNPTVDFGFVAPPTAASVTISGRVMTADGRGIARALVALSDSAGNTKTALTNGFGYYGFTDVVAGQTVTVSVSAKRYTFDVPAMLVTVNDAVRNLDFIANQ